MIEAGSFQEKVADMFQDRESFITRLLRTYRKTGNVKETPRSGRPKVITPAQDHFLTIYQ